MWQQRISGGLLAGAMTWVGFMMDRLLPDDLTKLQLFAAWSVLVFLLIAGLGLMIRPLRNGSETMSVDEKTDRQPVGFRITGAKNVTMRDNVTIGYENGYHIEDVDGLESENNVAIGPKGLRDKP